MSIYVCSNCGHGEPIFGAWRPQDVGGVRRRLSGALPLNLSIREQADSGRPTVVSEPDGEIAAIYKAVARQMAVKIAQRAKDFSSKFPTISISKTT